MMKWVFGLMLLLSVIFGIITGNAAPLTESALNSCVEAVELFLYLIGGMCMWGGLMRIAEKAGLTRGLAKIFRPLFKLLFPGLDPSSKAYGLICMNVAANVLGLGNAATPIGLNAMHELEIEAKKANLDGTAASRHMIVFIVLNTASITLIPQTAASLRLKHGSLSPFDIFPAVIVTSVIALTAGLLIALVFNAAGKKISAEKERQCDISEVKI